MTGAVHAEGVSARKSRVLPVRSQGAFQLRRLTKPRDEVAALCGVSGPAVSQWLSGTTKPRERQRDVLHANYGIAPASWDEPAEEAAEVTPEDGTEEPGPFDERAAVDALERSVRRTLATLAAKGTPLEHAKIARECAATLEKLAKLKNEDPVSLRKLWRSDVWRQVTEAHRRALGPYPEAAAALARELRALEAPEVT